MGQGHAEGIQEVFLSVPLLRHPGLLREMGDILVLVGWRLKNGLLKQSAHIQKTNKQTLQKTTQLNNCNFRKDTALNRHRKNHMETYRHTGIQAKIHRGIQADMEARQKDRHTDEIPTRKNGRTVGFLPIWQRHNNSYVSQVKPEEEDPAVQAEESTAADRGDDGYSRRSVA